MYLRFKKTQKKKKKLTFNLAQRYQSEFKIYLKNKKNIMGIFFLYSAFSNLFIFYFFFLFLFTYLHFYLFSLFFNNFIFIITIIIIFY